MNGRKYDFTGKTKVNDAGVTLHQIIAIRDFGEVEKYTIGGWIEKEENLSHEGSCWVYDDAEVYGNAIVRNHAMVCDNAKVCDNAMIFDNAIVCGNAKVRGYVMAYDNATIGGCAYLFGNLKVERSSVVSTISESSPKHRRRAFKEPSTDIIVEKMMYDTVRKYIL